MAAHKLLLHDLLREDQEPFMLNSYIYDKLKQQNEKQINHRIIQSKINQTPVLRKPNLSMTQLCKRSCFFSFRDSPDYKKSPIFQFSPPMNKSAGRGGKSPNPVFLNIPARTATVLFEAASRIQKNSSHSKTRQNHHQNNTKGSKFGLLGSILKNLTTKNRAQKRSNNVSLRWESEKVQEKLTVITKEKKCDVGFCSCSCNCSLRSSVCWSESNEGKFLDSETLSSSFNSEDELDERLLFESDEDRENGDFNFVVDDSCYEKSPFHFVLDRDLEEEDDCGTPEFPPSSPVTSPIHIKTEEKRGTKLQVQENETEEDEEKEQFSPVSVLDALFDTDEEDEDVDNEDDDCKDQSGFNIECSYAFVQKAKHQLLHKLRRFEQLAQLDPTELEKRILEDEQEEEYHRESHESSVPSCVNGSGNAAPLDMEKLVADLITEEEQRQETTCDDREEEIVKRVFKRLETFKNAESSNTIDMMVELDFKTEQVEGWKMNNNSIKHDQEQVKVMVMEIEGAVFRLLVEELSDDLLVC